MELLTQNLPSGYPYKFSSIRITPMFFAQIIEYLESVPKNPVEKYYFDYKLVLADDPNIDQLLLSDLDFVVFLKKALTIGGELKFKSTAICPYCGAKLEIPIDLSRIKFSRLDPEIYNGLKVELSGELYKVRLPRVVDFMNVFSKYRRYKKLSDMRLIRLISLFELTDQYHQKVENMVINATYTDITMLVMLDKIFFSSVNPLTTRCDCEIGNQRGVEIGIDSLISDFFREIIINNPLTGSKIISGEVRPND